jgi:valine--pyruvate aminotransferase
MQWSEVVEAVKRAGPDVIDLSIGNPLIVPEVSEALLRALADLAARPSLGEELGSYANYDGLLPLREAFAVRCSAEFGRAVALEEVVIVPGAQAGLRYLQELLRNEGRRILYPVGFEFPGSLDPLTPWRPSVGAYRSRPDGPGTCRVHFALDSFDWEDVGAVLVSQPHSPTGRRWTGAEIATLATAAAEHGAWLLLDETYGLPFAPITATPYTSVDASQAVHVYSFSKMGLAAERLGVVVAPAKITAALRGIMRRSIIEPPILGQYLGRAAVELFRRRPDLGARFGTLYRERWEGCRAALETAGALDDEHRVAEWEGGAFLWYEWAGAPTSDALFYEALAGGVAVAPSSALRLRRDSGDAEQPCAVRVGLGEPASDLERALTTVARCMHAPVT